MRRHPSCPVDVADAFSFQTIYIQYCSLSYSHHSIVRQSSNCPPSPHLVILCFHFVFGVWHSSTFSWPSRPSFLFIPHSAISSILIVVAPCVFRRKRRRRRKKKKKRKTVEKETVCEVEKKKNKQNKKKNWENRLKKVGNENTKCSPSAITSGDSRK